MWFSPSGPSTKQELSYMRYYTRNLIEQFGMGIVIVGLLLFPAHVTRQLLVMQSAYHAGCEMGNLICAIRSA